VNVLLLLAAGAALAAYDVNEVPLGASEAKVKERFPHVNCRPLEWRTLAADRRCDDSRIQFGGIDAGVTFYLRKDTVQGIDVRFHTGDWQRVAQHLRQRLGAPSVEGGPNGPLEWKSEAERARLSADREGRRATLSVWRGDFDEKLYKIP
jgi:hypothetical protein